MSSRCWITLFALSFTPAAAISADTPQTGKQVFDQVCSACHAAGLHGAPRVGDRDEWIHRASKGIDYLTRAAIRGHDRMPSRGCSSPLLDEEIRAAVTHMVRTSLEARTPVSSGPPAPAPR